jgi:6-phospho 3-hexuloisomerase
MSQGPARGTRKRALRYITDSIKTTIESIDCEMTDELVDALVSADRVFLYGAGRSGFVARCFTMRLGHLGRAVVRLSIDETSPPGARDLAIIISGTGETHSSLLYGRVAKDAGARVAVITEAGSSSLARMADITIVLTAPVGADRSRYAPMGTIFEDTALIYLDTLVVDLMERLGETEDTMRKRHGQLY